MCQWGSSDLLTLHGCVEWPLPLSESLHPVRQPFLSYHLPSCEAFRFLPVPSFLPGCQSSCSLLQLFVPHRSGNACACSLLPILTSLFPILHRDVFPCREVRRLLQTSGSLRLYSFHF